VVVSGKPDVESRRRAARVWIVFFVLAIVGAVSLSVIAIHFDLPRFIRENPLLTYAHFIAIGFVLVAVFWVVMMWGGGSGDPDE
jgi:hypothetical protein